MTQQRDRETVVVTEGRGSGMGAILGVIVILLLLAAVWYFTLGPGAGKSTNPGTTPGGSNPLPSVQVSLPAAS